MYTIAKFFKYACVIFVFLHTYSVLAQVSDSTESSANNVEMVKDTAKASKKLSKRDLEAMALEKMSADQVAEYLKAKVASDHSGLGVLVPLLVPISMFAVIPLCLFFLFNFRNKINTEKQQTLRAMVENGAQIPAEMFMDGRNSNPVDRDRRKGLLFTLSSTGFIIFLLAIEDTPEGLWAMGLIPLLLGIGYLISWRLGSAEQSKEG